MIMHTISVDKASLEIVRNSELFDPDWYSARYPDVAIVGLEPAEHYLKYGGILRRDPSPRFSTGYYRDVRNGKIPGDMNPLVHQATHENSAPPTINRVLMSANAVSRDGNHPLALDLAKSHLPADFHYTTDILQANEALRHGDEMLWLSYVNAYLANFGLAALQLGEGNSLISRLRSSTGGAITGGPLVSVIMPAWNAETTVEAAAQSILGQTWKNLELLIVDDASEDATWDALGRMAASDPRVKIFRNYRNVGPYVSKNLALQHATGDWITGQDADDWSHPQRIEDHVTRVVEDDNRPASITHMVRMTPDGVFSHIRPITNFSFDGVATKSSISCLYERRFMRERLGHWDSVRFGADSELIARASLILRSEVPAYRLVNMLCFDIPTSLTNNAATGVRLGKMSPVRAAYRESYTSWHKSYFAEGTRMPFPLPRRFYEADPCMVVPYDHCQALFDYHGK